MPGSGHPPQHSQADQDFIDTVKPSLLREFRDSVYTQRYIKKNATDFLNHDWIIVADLKEFIAERDSNPQLDDITVVASSSPPISRSSSPFNSPPVVKTENLPSLPLSKPVKVEDADTAIEIDGANHIRTQTICVNGTDFTEILSDSEDKAADIVKQENRNYYDAHGFEDHQTVEWEASDTNWEVPDRHSMVCISASSFRITDCENVECLERLDFLPPAWPIPKIPTAFLLDLSDEKYEFYDKHGIRLGPDHLLRKKDNDSWDTQSSGSGDSQVLVRFEPNEDRILCRRVQLKCKGVCVCEKVDRKLLQVERRELETSTRDTVFAAQEKARQEAGTTQRSAVLTFVDVVRSKKCCAKDNKGNICSGSQIMTPIKNSHNDYFFGCNGWKTTFKNGHSTHLIPRNIDRAILAHVFKTGEMPVALKDDAPACSTIVHPSTGLKQKSCAPDHVEGGRTFKARIVRYPCDARCTIFVPVNSSICKALIVHRGNTPHNHPLPPFLKLGLNNKQDYNACIDAAGSVGATVRRVDSAASTAVILKGQTPAEHAPGQQDGRKRRDLLHKVKLRNNPTGLGLAGAANLWFRDQELPVQDRYVHRYLTTPGAGLVIFTAYAELLALIHEVTSFEADTTFKRINDSVNELQVVLFYKPAQRTITIARVYVNSADTSHFKLVFDMLQEVVVEVTGKPMRFQRLSSGGNLLVMNSDMEAAQILGAGLSFLPTNESEYSGISTSEPGVLVQHFLKLCIVHLKRGVLNFKSLLSQSDYQRLMDLPTLRSEAELEEFDQFVAGLQLKKVSDWWAHKRMHQWIIPGLVRSQSKIRPKDWDATPDSTNAGKAQHHWTNNRTGTGLTIVDGIESARIADDEVRRSLSVARQTGSLTNTHNEYHHRVSRNVTRRSTATQNAREQAEEADATAQLQAELKGLSEAKKQKEAELKALHASNSNRKGKKPKALDSSSGRVAQSSATRYAVTVEKEDVSSDALTSLLSNAGSGSIDATAHEDEHVVPSRPSVPVLTELNVSGIVPDTFSQQLMDAHVPSLNFAQDLEPKPVEIYSDEDFKALIHNPEFLAMLDSNELHNQLGMDEIGGLTYDLDPELRFPFSTMQTTACSEQFTLPPVPQSLPPSPYKDYSLNNASAGSLKSTHVEVDESNILEEGTVRVRSSTFKVREGAASRPSKRARHDTVL